LYLAPAYAAYYLRHYIFQAEKSKPNDHWIRSFSLLRCVKLALVIITPFIVSFGPFIFLGQINQVLQRLFPIKRGLTHAYWAPNLWTLYNSADLLAYQALKRLGRLPVGVAAPTYTSGLVQEYAHSILPSISPLVTLLLTAGSMLPFCLITLRGRVSFLSILTLCAFNSYLFGWHVHEKAILLITIPLAISAVQDRRFAGCFVVLATVAHCSLFPLFFTGFEAPIKYGTTILYSAFAVYGLRFRFGLESLHISK
uniref:Alpha-1,3-glucosyltransferase n=1 Tax=Plectus sambesii TaxID=2011161 RepID=A0A914VIN1_9BILA